MKKTKSRAPAGKGEWPAGANARVAVVVTTFDHAHFLDDALLSLDGQTRLPDKIVVVDDGSRDDPASVVARYPRVELVTQSNAGLAAARNTGLAAVADCDFVTFLDADDRLLPDAIERQLRCFAEHPGCGFVYGRHRRVDAALRPLETSPPREIAGSAYDALLGYNFIGMHAAVLYARAKLVECGGFDPALRRCEDYDAYFRMALRHPVAGHGGVVADYRIHGDNMSGDPAEMLDWALCVQQRYRPPAHDHAGLAAYRAGRRRWRLVYANAAWADRSRAGRGHRRAMISRAPFTSFAAAGWRAVRPLLPERVITALRRRFGHQAPAVGTVDLGDLARATPISLGFGADRGKPIDRWYIEQFLARHSADIRGRALEIAEPDYCERFGAGVTRQDVLHVHADNPLATIIGDLTQPGVLPEGAFDCMVITQTLHLIYDMRAAIAGMKRALAPGGVLLLTVPGVSSIDRGEWGATWYWSLTEASAKRLFDEMFGAANVEVTVGGNVYSATAFLHGLALEEIDQKLLATDDLAYPLVICVRARRDG